MQVISQNDHAGVGNYNHKNEIVSYSNLFQAVWYICPFLLLFFWEDNTAFTSMVDGHLYLAQLVGCHL